MGGIVAERLINLREACGFSQSELARRAGGGQSSINRLEAGETRAPRNITAIAKALGTSPEYLLGETDDPSPTAPSGESQVLGPHDTAASYPDLVEIDYVEIGFGMGGGFIEESGDVAKRAFSRAWLREFTDAPPELLAWAKGDGDSMEPTIRDGEVVLIDRRFTQPGPNDQIWAITVGEFGMIKRLRARPDGTVEILSDNELVPVQTAVDGELHVIGRVRAVIRRV